MPISHQTYAIKPCLITLKNAFLARNALSAHNWAHAYRDTINAIVIGEAEGADMHIVYRQLLCTILASYTVRADEHGENGAERVTQSFTRANAHYSAEQIAAIANCIRHYIKTVSMVNTLKE